MAGSTWPYYTIAIDIGECSQCGSHRSLRASYGGPGRSGHSAPLRPVSQSAPIGACLSVCPPLGPVSQSAPLGRVSQSAPQWGVCIMAAHSNRWLLRGKWVAGQSVRCCFPVFGKELTVSFALALGRFFSSKGCQIERFIFSGTSIKG